MSLAASDLVVYCSANMPDADGTTAGGAIDALRRADFTQLAANDDVEVVSTSASDTQNCTIEARKADGTVVSETLALTGTTAKIFSGNGVVERILKVELASAAVGTITVQRSVAGATIRTIPVGERGFMMPFRKCAADASGGSQRDFYAKVFVKNTNGTFAALSTVIKQVADADARITHLPAAANDDTATVANRQTAPAAADTLDPDTFDDTDKTVGTIGTGAARGVWLRMRLPAGDPAHKYTYQLGVDAQTT